MLPQLPPVSKTGRLLLTYILRDSLPLASLIDRCGVASANAISATGDAFRDAVTIMV